MNKNYLYLIVGGFTLGIGIALCDKAGWGADPVVTLYEGLVKTFDVSLDNASMMVAVVLLVIAAFVDYREIGIGTILMPIATQFGIKFGLQYISVFDNHYANIMFMIVGLAVIGVSIAITIVANVGKSCNDALIIGIMHRSDKQYYHIRWFMDSIFLLLGVLLGGGITLGTVVGILFLGKIVNISKQYMESYKKEMIERR